MLNVFKIISKNVECYTVILNIQNSCSK